MALTYTEMANQSHDANFVQRVQMALLQDVNANKIQATTPANTDVTMTAQRDRLGRLIVRDPFGWATLFARLVALQLISKTTLLDPAVTTDGDIFSAEGAVYDRFLASL